MDTALATRISVTVCGPERRLVEGIRLLRGETHMGLLEAKTYLERFTSADVLYMQLCDDFVTSKLEILNVLLQDRARLDERILNLQQELEKETEQEMMQNDPLPYTEFTQVGTGAVCRVDNVEIEQHILGRNVVQEQKYDRDDVDRR